MIRALLAKELRQHWPGLLVLAFLWLVIYLLVALGSILQDAMLSPFELLGSFLHIGAVLGSVTLGRLLVVSEYRERTQLFLDALPVSRIAMIAVKWFLGAAVLMGLVLAAFLLTTLLAWRNESWSLRFALFLLARAGAACLAVYAFFFLMGFLGRYRFLIYALVFLFFFAASQLRQFEMDNWGPFHLLGPTFAYERDVFPWEAFRITCLTGGICIVGSFFLGLLWEGSLSALFAERMSQREKVVIALVILTGFYGVYLLDTRTPKQPFDLDDAAMARSGRVTVKVAGTDELSTGLAERLAAELADLRTYLQLPGLPSVFLVERGDLDPDLYERGILKETEGFLARAAFRDSGFNEERFCRWLVGELLAAQSHDGVRAESCRWVYDGFPDFWAQRHSRPQPMEDSRPLIFRALYGLPQGITDRDLSTWLRFRETLGDDIAAGVAWSGLEVLASRQGDETARSFVRHVLGCHLPRDVRAAVHRRLHSPARVYRNLTGQSFDSFLTEWNGELDRCRGIHHAAIESLPRLRAEFEFVSAPGDSYDLNYRLLADPPLSSPVRYALRYCALPPMNEEVHPEKIRETAHVEESLSQHVLARPFSKGSRVFHTLSAELPELECSAITGWIRSDVPPQP
ncbi:MAG TPA: hypothetical protein VMN36_16760 [Verrucomicrobiales bacterium]|nr:hypothetical protein [Verrucomicrobiales bacterium]